MVQHLFKAFLVTSAEGYIHVMQYRGNAQNNSQHTIIQLVYVIFELVGVLESNFNVRNLPPSSNFTLFLEGDFCSNIHSH